MWNTNAPAQGSTTYDVLPTDSYIMKVVEAGLEDNRFGTPDRDGNLPKQVVLTWELSKLSAEQEEAGITLGEKVRQYINAYYGVKKDGTPSAFMALVQSLVEQQMLPEGEFDVEDFIGITQRIAVLEYTKEKGENAGSQGNKVTAVNPLKLQRKTRPMVQPNTTPTKPLPSTPADSEDLPF
jgi:hypothetical protein